jgi:lysine/ornithine N-monooxygenase
MPARKMRVEVFDDNGNRYTISFQGRVTREKALRIFDIVELLGGMRGFSPKWGRNISKLSKYDKVRLVIDKHFPTVWFSSREVQSIYEEEFKEPISLSTVSTYLSRMADRGFLMKNQASGRRKYRMVTEIMKRVMVR